MGSKDVRPQLKILALTEEEEKNWNNQYKSIGYIHSRMSHLYLY